MSREAGLETAYKKAVVKIARDLPALIEAMNELSRSLKNMPRSVRIRY